MIIQISLKDFMKCAVHLLLIAKSMYANDTIGMDELQTLFHSQEAKCRIIDKGFLL